LGTPFAPWPARNVPVAIALRHDPLSGGIVWERVYGYRDRAVLVRSIKRSDGDGLSECGGGGFGIRPAVYEAGGALPFRSLFYFRRLAGRTIRLPDALTPGTAHVIHQELGGGRFRFVMTIRHRLFGTTFHQDGVFQHVGDHE